jgi:hypothetical protein
MKRLENVLSLRFVSMAPDMDHYINKILYN